MASAEEELDWLLKQQRLAEAFYKEARQSVDSPHLHVKRHTTPEASAFYLSEARGVLARIRRRITDLENIEMMAKEKKPVTVPPPPDRSMVKDSRKLKEIKAVKIKHVIDGVKTRLDARDDTEEEQADDDAEGSQDSGSFEEKGRDKDSARR